MKSVMQHSFSNVPDVKLQRSKFNRTRGLKTTFSMGDLVPIMVDEALPGDTFNLRLSCFGRLNTPLCPIMDNIYLDTFFFAVPNRLLWTKWQRFCGEQLDPDDPWTDYTLPIMDVTQEPLLSGYVANSLEDYFGLPTEVAAIPGINALAHRAYNRIWVDWFRDQNMQDPVALNTGDGPDDGGDYTLLKRGKRHDYFTSCLPWPQKGDAVTLPLGDTAPVQADVAHPDIFLYDGVTDRRMQAKNTTKEIEMSNTWGSNNALRFGEDTDITKTGLVTDLSSATASTINALRQAFQIQRLLERDARAGSRYTEILRSHFGVVSPDARLQRPEYLGGGRTNINISPIAQTSVAAATPQGNLAAIGTLSASGHGFSKSFTEHCVIIGLACVTADLTYQQGLDRMWTRSTRWDFYWPSLANIGEQAVLNKEIYCQGPAGGSDDDDVFGYQERYAEYRYARSMITGVFRSNHAQSLDKWHLAQEFGSLPTLDATFIEETPPTSRVMAVNTQPDILFDAYFDLVCVRPMPVYSVPGMIDHF